MHVTLRMYCTELLGTFLLVLFGAGTICASHLNLEARLNTVGLPFGLDITAIALAEGLALGVLLALFGPGKTAGFNPAITLALYIRQKFDLTVAALLIVAQLIGAVLAGLVVRLIFNDEILRSAHAGTPHLFAFPGEMGVVTVAGLSTGAGLELLFAAVLAFCFCWWTFDANPQKISGVLVGLVMVAILLFGFRLTGAAANPARWFGTVVWEATLTDARQVFNDHPVYWAGPIAGAVLGSVLAGFLQSSSGERKR